MNPFVSIRRGWFWLDLGWYRGEPFALIKVGIVDIPDSWPAGIDQVVFLSIQIAKFLFAFGWKSYN